MNKAFAWVAAAGAAVVFAGWRRRSAHRAHADLYFDDGSMVSLTAGDEDADRLLAVACDLVEAARRPALADGAVAAGSRTS